MEDKYFDLLTAMYAEMKDGFSKVNDRIDKMDNRIDSLQSEVKTLGNQVIRIENELKPKIEAALDGYKQHTDILERIEEKVTYHEEVILRRVK